MIEWRDGALWSSRFGDVYFSVGSGREEKEHVFVAGNDLPRRFARLAPGETFTIGETGFGTGLNFLCAWRAFEGMAPPGAQLDYFSVEKFPLDEAELVAAVAPWPELAPYAEALGRRWRRRVPGWNRWHFAGGRVRLTLAWTDVAEALPELPDASIDAWFLDGFSPARNPEMWSQAVCRALARAARPGATLATYTVAGWVRRQLAEAGFETWKVTGYGRKRHMLRGVRPGASPARPASIGAIAVIGGGLAGCHAAFALARRGLSVTLVEAAPGLAAGASGNPLGMLHLRLAAGMGPLQRLVLAAFGHALALLDETLPADGKQRAECGLLQLAVNGEEAARIARLAALPWPERLLQPVTASQAASLAGLALGVGGLWFPQAGWVAPAAWCARLARAIPLRLGERVTTLSGGPGKWLLGSSRGGLGAEAVVVANAHGARQLARLGHLPLKPVRGQITEVAATAASRALRPVVCGEGYVTPAVAGRHVVGATTHFDDAGTDLRAQDHADNLARLGRQMPALYAALGGGQAVILGGRAGVRCSAPGALPVVGELAPGLLVSLAHGTRGLLTAGLAGELIAARLTGTLPPLPASLVAVQDSGRFRHLDGHQTATGPS